MNLISTVSFDLADGSLPQYLASVALLISDGVQKRTLGLVRDWTPAVVGTALPVLGAVRRGRDMKGNLRTANESIYVFFFKIHFCIL